jgi:YVTN family beta-propeller protein
MPTSVNLGAGTTPAGTPSRTPRFLFVSNDVQTASVYTVNATTGQLRANSYVVPGSFQNTNAPGQVVMYPNGQFVYMPNIVEDTLAGYVVDASGALTPLPFLAISTGVTPTAAAITADGQYVYVANLRSNTVRAYAVNAGTGALTVIADVATGGALPLSPSIRAINFSTSPMPTTTRFPCFVLRRGLVC